MSKQTMKVARFSSKGANLELVDQPIPVPAKGQVRIEIYACGVCHSDVLTQSGAFGNTFPRVPGHEVAGVVDAVGEGVTEFKKGDKVGVGWFGGDHCGACKECRMDTWVCCSKQSKVSGISYDGGYAEYMVAPQDALARIPQELDFAFAGPLMCAGVTVFNSMRNAGVIAPGNCVVLGVGGLGHLAIQFGAKLGLNVIAVSQGKEKEELAKKLGAHVYIDSKSTNAVEEINKRFGGADLIVQTAPTAKLIEEYVPALGCGGKLLVIGLPDAKPAVDALHLLSKRASIVGWASGDSRDSEATLNFAALTGVEAMIETFPLEKAQEAFERMLSNKARFRAVIQVKK